MSGRNELSETLRRIDRLRRGGSLEQALGLVRELLEAHPLDARIHFELGLTLALWAGKPAEALPHFDRAVQLGPAMRSARLHRALALARLGRHADALVDLEWLEASRYRNALFLHTLLAESHQALGHPAEAERNWSLALKHDASNPWLLQQRAAVRVALGRLNDARADLDAALAHQTRDEPSVDLDLLQARADLRARLGDRDGAREDLDRALAEAEARGDTARAQRLRQALGGLD